MDGRIVNVADDGPVTVLEMTELAGNPIEGSAEPLATPWSGRMDTTLAHQLGFRPTCPPSTRQLGTRSSRDAPTLDGSSADARVAGV